MVQPTSFRVFLSAVSNELASYRTEVARVLRRRGIEVRDQLHFRQGDGTLIEKLRDYIRECDAVIQLVGDQCGSLVGEEHAAVLGGSGWFDRFEKASGCSQASYTQWEFLLAKQFGKKTYTFLTTAGFQGDKPSHDTPQQQHCQTEYRKWIEQIGERYDPLTTKAKLVEDVLVLPFPDLGQPKPNNLPYPSLGSLFKGREQFLADLHAKLTKSPHTAAAITTRPQAVHGAGGIGKTRAAIEYAWRHAEDYTALLFLAADSPAALESSLAGLVGVLPLDGMDEAADDVRLAAVLAWLRSHPGWLAILDNVDTDDAASAAKARLRDLTDGRVLITSRISQWIAGVEKLDLDVLAVDDAAEYLLEAAGDRLRSEDDSAAAKAVAVQVGQLALGLEHAAAYINAGQFSFAEYLARWDDDEAAILQEFDLTLIDYPRELLVTWKMSVERLDGDARKLLEIFSWFAPEPIPETIFADLPEGLLSGDSDVEQTESDFRSLERLRKSPRSVPTPGDWRKAVTALARYCLVNRGQSGDQRFLQLHRLVQATSRYHQRHAEATDAGLRLPSLEDALRWIDAAYRGRAQDVRDWPKLDPLVDHVLAICDFAEGENKTTVDHATSRLLGDAGVLFDVKARNQTAESLKRRALAIDEQSYGAEHPRVAIRASNLAALLWATNRAAEAEPLMRRALAIDEQSYGAEHPDVASDLNNLAQLLQATSRLAEAEPLMRRALAIDEQSYGAEHPSVARDFNNLAGLLYALGKIDEAIPLYERVIVIFEKNLGRNHPNVAVAINNLALLLLATNRSLEAEPLHRRALAIGEQSYGLEHPEVATHLNNLALLLQATNRQEEAEPLMRRALAIDEQSYGAEHPDVARDLSNLALLLQHTNRRAEAEPLMRRALAIDEQSYGAEHPEVAIRLNNLAALLLATNRSSEAKPLMGRAVKILRASLGKEHPNTVKVVDNYRRLWAAMG